MKLNNIKFKLLENNEGLAADDTVMVFDNSDAPNKASYSGPNIEYGHAIVSSILSLPNRQKQSREFYYGLTGVNQCPRNNQ